MFPFRELSSSGKRVDEHVLLKLLDVLLLLLELLPDGEEPASVSILVTKSFYS
jgi:hypothetical protein